jgi:hypothetical protein
MQHIVGIFELQYAHEIRQGGQGTRMYENRTNNVLLVIFQIHNQSTNAQLDENDEERHELVCHNATTHANEKIFRAVKHVICHIELEGSTQGRKEVSE